MYAVVVFSSQEIHFITLPQLRTTRKYSLSSKLKKTKQNKTKQRKCDSIEIHVVTHDVFLARCKNGCRAEQNYCLVS